MKLLKKNPNGKMLNIGEDEKTSSWYKITDDKLQAIADKLNKGDDISFKFETRGGRRIITFLAGGEVEVPKDPPPKTEPATPEPEKTDAPPVKTEQHDKLVVHKKACDDTEVEHTCMQATGRIMISMQGRVDEKNVYELSQKIYEHLITLMK